jgi:hypothetical protein
MAKTGIRRIEIEPTLNRGFTVTHAMHDSGKGPMKPDQKFAFGNQKALLAHVAKHTAPSSPAGFKDSIKSALDTADSTAAAKSPTPIDEE